MVSFWISVGTNKLRVSSNKTHAWNILSMKVTQLLLQRTFPVNPVKHNATCHYVCALYILCVLKNYREIFIYFLSLSHTA